MPNPYVQFGKSIKPLQVTDLSKNKIQILFNRLSTDENSANITVGVEPWVVKAFGLEIGQEIAVCNVFNNMLEPLFYNDEEVVLNSENNTVVMPISGVYRLIAPFTLGDLVCIAYPLSAMEERAKKNAAISNPAGVHKNRPNTFFDGSAGQEFSHEFTVGSTSAVLRAYGLSTQVIRLLNVFDDEQEQVVAEGEPVELDEENNTLIVHISGVYKLQIVGDSTDVRVTTNPTNVVFTEPFVKRGLPGPEGPPGPGEATYTHTQGVAALTWTINHNLGFFPSVELRTVGGIEFNSLVIHSSVNTTLVENNLAIAGTARLT